MATITTTTITVTTTDKDGSHTHHLTLSETARKHVLRSFNPEHVLRSLNPERDDDVKANVDLTKTLCAGLIQQMINLRDVDQKATAAQKRGASTAITFIEAAQMAAVKANFAQA